MEAKVPRRLRGGEPGYILYLVLGFTILLGLGTLLVIGPMLGEVTSAGNQVRDKRAFFRADGGATLCRGELLNRLQVALPAQLSPLKRAVDVSGYVDTNNPAGFLKDYAYQAGTSLGDPFRKDSNTQASLNLSSTPPDAAAPYTCTLTVTSRGTPINQGTPISPAYLFRYSYTSDGMAAEGGLSRQVNVQGSFSILVQQQSFARYALFTNKQEDSSGSRVWFTNRTNFSGPVHTNGQFNFALNPGASFTGEVTSVSREARYYNKGDNVTKNADRNEDIDVPYFGAGFTRGVDTIPMPSETTADRQREAALGLTEGATISGYGDGVYLGTADGAMKGGIYVKGDASISLAAGGPGIARYTIVQGGKTRTITVNYGSKQTTIQEESKPASTYAGVPNGMLFVEGSVDSLAGTVQRNTELTIAATDNVKITNNLTYESFTTGPPPSAEGTTNLLGILSWNGNVRITTDAPDNISVHATVMTPQGEFRVDDYNKGTPRGTATILGGVIEDTYGAFGTFDNTGHKSGYGRNFVYDTRMGRGIAPPFFPTTGRVISSVVGINARPNWQQTN